MILTQILVSAHRAGTFYWGLSVAENITQSEHHFIQTLVLCVLYIRCCHHHPEIIKKKKTFSFAYIQIIGSHHLNPCSGFECSFSLAAIQGLWTWTLCNSSQQAKKMPLKTWMRVGFFFFSPPSRSSVGSFNALSAWTTKGPFHFKLQGERRFPKSHWLKMAQLRKERGASERQTVESYFHRLFQLWALLPPGPARAREEGRPRAASFFTGLKTPPRRRLAATRVPTPARRLERLHVKWASQKWKNTVYAPLCFMHTHIHREGFHLQWLLQSGVPSPSAAAVSSASHRWH